jgi:hypothetical protein
MKIIPKPLEKFLTEEAHDRIEFFQAISHTDEIPAEELKIVALAAVKSGELTKEMVEAVHELETAYMLDIAEQGQKVSREGERAVRVNPYTNRPY